jgi:hypothetical protein
MDLKKTVSIVLTATLLLSMLLFAIPKAYAETTVEFVPSITEIHYDPLVPGSDEFTVSCMINDVTDLAGFDIQLAWDTAHIQYVSHTATLGCLITPTFTTKDVIDDPGLGPGTYWLAAATLSGTGFTGSAEAFEMTFRAINIPFDDPASFFDVFLVFTNGVDLADSAAISIPHTAIDGTVRIYYQEFVYPPEPFLYLDEVEYDGTGIGGTFTAGVYLTTAAFWHVGGIDVYMNFDPTALEATSVAIDPAGEFLAFWHSLYIVAQDIDNTAGTVHVAFMGVPPAPGAPSGDILMFSVDFTELTESTTYPAPTYPITLKNPLAYYGEYRFDSIGGLMDPATPVGTDWHELTPTFSLGPFSLDAIDDLGALGLSAEDQVILNDGTWYFDYYVKDLKGGLNLDHLGTEATEYDIWAASFGPDNLGDNGLPGRYVGTDDPYNGFGVPYWTGNFSMPGLSAVTSITVHCLPYTADEYTYTLTEGVDYLVHADEDLIELLTPVDVDVVDYFVDGVNNTLNGWPWINYVASSFTSVYRWFPAYNDYYGESEGFATNLGYSEAPPSEYWFDPDWTWELEGWWALGYFPGDWVWPAGTAWELTYTAASTLEVSYLSEPEGPYFLEYPGSYSEYLAALTAPVGTTWNEVYFKNWRVHEIIEWTDVNTNTMLDAGDGIKTLCAGNVYVFNNVNDAVELVTGRKPWICEDSPTDKYFGWAPIVQIAGFPQPDADYCPWHNKEYSVPLPHTVRNAIYTPAIKLLGGMIDVYVCNYAPGFKGEGLNEPADMFWPQKQVLLCANVTYAGWPEQNKDVAFEIKRPLYVDGVQVGYQLWMVLYARTDSEGHAEIPVRLPWPCDDPEEYFGKWKVWATVDVACVVVNDTMEFKYDYRIHIWDVVPDKTEYKHCEDIVVTVYYGSYLIQTSLGHLIITLTVTDASGVPIGFDYVEVVLGTDDMNDWCQYLNGTVTLSVHVVKWARPPIGYIYVGALTDFPQNGGSAETPVYTTQVAILAEWAVPP